MSRIMEISIEEDADYELILEKIGEMDEEEEFEGVLAVRDVSE